MKKFLRSISVLLAVILVLSCSTAALAQTETTLPAPAAVQATPSVSPVPSSGTEPLKESVTPVYDGGALKAKGIALMDASTGRLLVDTNADVQIFPASTTKIMTCLIALERGNLDDSVTASAKAAGLSDSNSKIHLVEGEVLTLRQMLYGLMLPSGNDAAIAIAEHIAGSEEAFAELMNQKAEELGMTGTHFVNAHGFHDPDHYSTPRDMAILTKAALQNGNFAAIIAKEHYTIPASNKSAERYLTNSNRMLHPDKTEYYEGCTGGKTGYTDAAKGCLVVTAKRNDIQLIACIYDDGDFASNYRWGYATSLLNFGFNNYTSAHLSDLLTATTINAEVENAQLDSSYTGTIALNFTPGSDTVVHLFKQEAEALQTNNSLFTLETSFPGGSLKAPITQGSAVGKVAVSYQGEELASYDLIASQDVQKGAETPEPTASPVNPGPSKSKTALDAILLIVIILCILFILLFIIRAINRRRYRKRRSKKYSSSSARKKTSSRRRPPNPTRF